MNFPAVKWPLAWLLLLLNILIWLPIVQAPFLTIGVGHDSQLFAPGIHALLRTGNMPWDLLTRLPQARVDIFSYPYFSIIYPFYGTLGVAGDFSYEQHLVFDFLSVVFHMVVASVTFSVLLSRMGCRVSIAAIGGCLYAYSLYMKLWSAWIWAIAGYAWLPLCLLGVWEIVSAERRRLGIVYLACGFGLMSLATGVGLVYAVVLSGILMLALWVRAARTVKAVAADLAFVVTGGLLGSVMGAAHLLPVLNRMPDYIRWHSGGAVVGQFKPPYEATLAPALQWPEDLLQWFLPMSPGAEGSVGHLYVGIAVLALAILFLLRRGAWRSFATILWIFSVYFLLDAMGEQTPVHRLTYELPLLGAIRYPLANVVIPVVLIVLMGCVALEQILRRETEGDLSARLEMTLVYIAVLAVGVLQFSSAPELLTGVGGGDVRWIYWLPPAIALIGVLGILFRERSLKRLIPMVLLFAYLPQLSMLTHPKIPEKAQLYHECQDFQLLNASLRSWLKAVPKDSRLLVKMPEQQVQGCLKELKITDALMQSLAGMAGWNVLQGYISPRPFYEFKLFSRYGSDKALASNALMLQAGVSHVLTFAQMKLDALPDQAYKRVGQAGQFALYEVRDWQLGQNIVGCLVQKTDRSLIRTNEGRRAILLPQIWQGNEAARYRCTAEFLKSDSTLIKTTSTANMRYEIATESTAIFVSDRVMRDDWVVRVNGDQVNPEVVDGYRIAIGLAPGKSVITLDHEPWDFRLGLIISGVGLLITLVLLIMQLYLPRPLLKDSAR